MMFCILHYIYATRGSFFFIISLWNNEDVKARPRGTVEIEFLEHHCCCHVDTHSIATLCCPASQGDAAPAPLLGPGSSMPAQRQLLAPGNVIPASEGGKILKQTQAKERQEEIRPFWGSPWEPVGFWIFQRFFSFFSSWLCYYNVLRCTGPVLSTESEIFFSWSLCSALIQPENPQMSKSVGTSHGFL